MGFKGIYFMLIILSLYLIKHTDALPRNIIVVEDETLSELHEKSLSAAKGSLVKDHIESGNKIPGRLNCPYVEPTEYDSCQEHCLPKGYSYGICVSETCSCI